MVFLKLFYEFFKIGLFAIGGGAATIPFLSKLSDASGWFTKTDLANMVAISESTPGAIGVNMATYVGFLVGEMSGNSLLGCIIASIGLVTPSIIIIIIISGLLNRFKNSGLIGNIFYGIRPASTGLIAAAAFEIVKISIVHFDLFAKTRSFLDLIDIKGLILFIGIFIALKKIKLHPITFIGISALVGIIFKF